MTTTSNRVRLGLGLVAFAVALLAASCTAGIIVDIKQTIAATKPGTPVAALASSQSSPVSAHEQITITFTQSMNTSSLTIPSGDFASLWAAGNVTTTWASYNSKTNAQLTIAPKSSNYSLWPQGSMSLNLTGSSTEGIALGATSLPITVAARVYVHATSTSAADKGISGSALDGTEAAAGTQAAPMATLQYAVNFAKLRYNAPSGSRVEVWAAGCGSAGPYASNYYSTGKPALAMTEGVSVRGGYSPSNWGTRDASTYATVIKDASTGYTSGWNTAVTIGTAGTPSGITNATYLDGCTIQGSATTSGTSPKCAGVLCDSDASPTINNCIVSWPSTPATTAIASIGIRLQGSGAPQITNCTSIDGGNAATTYGIYVSTTSAPASSILIEYSNIYSGNGSTASHALIIPSIVGNTKVVVIGSLISAASNTNGSVKAYGVYLDPGTTSLSSYFFNNVILGGKGGNGSNATLATGIGVYCHNTAPALINNTICSGNDGRNDSPRTYWPTCIYISSNTGPTLINNYLFSPDSSSVGCGIIEADASTSRPATCKNNAILTNQSGGYSYVYGSYSASGPVWLSAAAIPSGPLYDSSLLVPVNNYTGFTNNIALYRGYSTNGIDASTGMRNVSAWPSAVQGGGLTLTALDFNDFPSSGGTLIDKAKNPRTANWTIGAYEYD